MPLRKDIAKSGKVYWSERHINYPSWSKMMHRCYNPKSNKWSRYGQRGIKVCKRWHKFSSFNEDMGNKLPGQSIGRIDNNGQYCPSNCRWETPKQQGNNTSRTIFLEYVGKKMSLKEWALELDINYSTLRSRSQIGKSVEEILFKKPKSRGFS